MNTQSRTSSSKIVTFKIIGVLIGIVLSCILLASIEFTSRFIYFKSTMLTDPESANIKDAVRVPNIDFVNLPAHGDVNNITATDGSLLVMSKFELNDKRRELIFASTNLKEFAGKYLVIKSIGKINKYVANAARISILVNGVDRVTANAKTLENSQISLETLLYIPKDLTKLEIKFSRDNYENLVIDFDEINIRSAPLYGIMEFLKVKGFYEWTWSFNKLKDRNFMQSFPRARIPSGNEVSPLIFTLGGSTTYGWGVSPEQVYPAQIEKFLREKDKNFGTVINFGVVGISSQTTNEFIKNTLSKYNPSIYVIHDGYNDLPLILKKEGSDSYEYIPINDSHAFNPVMNPIASFFRYNFWSTRNRLFDNIAFIRDLFANQGNIFLGHDYTKLKVQKGNSQDIEKENQFRTNQLISNEIDTIRFALKNNQKVILVLQPEIFPNWAPTHTGFRDITTGEIQKKNHDSQQRQLLEALKEFSDNPNIQVVDLRKILSPNYREYYVDESHLNGAGNTIVGQEIAKTVMQMYGKN